MQNFIYKVALLWRTVFFKRFMVVYPQFRFIQKQEFNPTSLLMVLVQFEPNLPHFGSK